MSHQNPGLLGRRSALVALAAGFLGGHAKADLDPSLPHDLSPGAAMPWAELCCNQAGLSPVLLPRRGSVRWRTLLSGGLASGPGTDGRGHVLVCTLDGSLVELDHRGRRLWERRLRAVAASHPAVGADGARVVLTRSGHFQRFDAEGEKATVTLLPTPLGRGRPLLLPQSDGSFVVTIGSDVHWLERDGDLRARTRVGDVAARLLQASGRVLIHERRGRLWAWDGVAQPQAQSDLAYSAVARAGKQGYVAAQGSRILRGPWERLSQPALDLGSPSRVLGVAQLSDERLVLRLAPDWLVVAKAGTELARHALSSTIEATDFGLLTDAKGGAMSMSHGGRIVLLNEHSQLESIEHPPIPTATGLIPTRPGQAVAASASGLVFGIGTTE